MGKSRTLRLTIAVGTLLTTLVVLTPAATAAPRFIDVPDSHLFQADIEWLAAQGITLGCNPPANDRFCPGDPVTREQMAAFLVRALNLTDNGGGNNFTDDDSSIFETDIAKLAAARITLGCNPPANDQFCPSNVVTRGQMAAFLRRALPDDQPAVDIDTVADGQAVDMTGAGTGTGSFTLGGTLSDDIVKVRVSLGSEFGDADIDNSTSPARWEIDASAPSTGRHTFLVEATDRAGRTVRTETTLEITAPDPDELLLDPDVVIVDAADPELDLISYNRVSGAVVFSGDIAGVIEVGSILVGQPIASIAPNGFLRRVIAVSVVNGTTVATTVHATLLEAVRQASQGLSAGPAVPKAFINDGGSAAEGIFDGRYGVGLADTLSYSNQFTNPDYPGWTVDVAGEARAAAELFIDIDKKGIFDIRPVLKELIVSASGGVSGNMAITGTASAGFASAATLASHQLGPAFIGPAPVTLESEIVGEVRGQATGTVGVSGGFDVSFETLAHRLDGVTTTEDEFTSTGNLDLTAQADLEAGIGLKLQVELLIADAVGPSVTFGPELIAKATIDLIQRLVPWSIRVDLVADLGITGQTPVFDIEFIDESFELWRGTLATLESGTNELASPHLRIAKTLSGYTDQDSSNGISLSDTLSYSIDVENDGSETVSGVVVEDSTADTLTCVPSAPFTLAVDQTATCTATYVVAEADIAEGEVVNTATAVGTAAGSVPVTAEDTNVAPTQIPVVSLALAKTYTNADEDGSLGVSAGDTLTFSLAVDNDGNTVVDSINVSDSTLNSLTCAPNLQGPLAPGGSGVCTGNYTVTNDDVAAGSITNRATVSGSNLNYGTADVGTELTIAAQVPAPSLRIVKTFVSNSDDDGSNGLTAGDTLHYRITAMNDGNVGLTDVTIADPLIPTLDCSAILPAPLAVSESVVCTGTYTFTADDYTARGVVNTASGTALDPDNNPVLASDTKTVARPEASEEAVLISQPTGFWRLNEPAFTNRVRADFADSAGVFDGVGYCVSQIDSFVGNTDDGAAAMGGCDGGGGARFPFYRSSPLFGDDFTFEIWIDLIPSQVGEIFLNDAVRFEFPRYEFAGDFSVDVHTSDGATTTLNASLHETPGVSHVVLAKDGTAVRLHVNGFQVGTATLPTASLELNYANTAGIHIKTNSFEIQRVDQMAIYDKALTVNEVSEHYITGGFAGAEQITSNALYDILADDTSLAPDNVSTYVESFTGTIFSWETEIGDEFYRYTERYDSIGRFYTRLLFVERQAAVDALTLEKWGNNAQWRQDVTTNTPYVVYVGMIAEGVPPGAVQVFAIDGYNFDFTPGVDYDPDS